MRTFAIFGFAFGFSLALGACSSESGSTDATSGAGGSNGVSGSTTSAASGSTSASSSSSSSTSGVGGGAPAAFKVQVYASDPAGPDVNSVLVSGVTDAVLVDSQFFKADTDKVIELVKASGKTLKTVLLTHAHPDHYLGLDQLHTAFPNAQVVATKDVVDDFNKSAQGTLEFLKMQPFGAQVADKIFAPTALAGDTIDLEGQKLKVISLLKPGESAHAAALGIPNPNALIAGDLLYNNAHLVISECASQGWIENLTTVKALGYTTFYPGHGAEATAAVFDADAQYLKDAVPIMDKAATEDEAKAQIKAKYPDYQSDFLLGFSVGQYFANCKVKP